MARALRLGGARREAAREDAAVVGREANDLDEALRLLALPVGADEQVLAARRAPGRAEGADDVGEDVGDLHHPVVAFGHIRRASARPPARGRDRGRLTP